MRMIIDGHTHIGAREHFSPTFVAEMVRAWGEIRWPEDDLGAHREAVATVGRAIVVAMDAPAVGMVVPNEYVSDYVATQPDKLIGFASVDPNRPDAFDRLTYAVEELGLRGLKARAHLPTLRSDLTTRHRAVSSRGGTATSRSLPSRHDLRLGCPAALGTAVLDRRCGPSVPRVEAVHRPPRASLV